MKECKWMSIDGDCMLTYDEKLNGKKCENLENCSEYEESDYYKE